MIYMTSDKEANEYQVEAIYRGTCIHCLHSYEAAKDVVSAAQMGDGTVIWWHQGARCPRRKGTLR